MLKRFLIVVVLIVIALYCFRGRVYLREPLATVYHNGVKQSGVEVYINQPKDVLLLAGDDRIMVQHWDRMPAAPVKLTCLRWTMCFTDQDNAAKAADAWNTNFTYDPKVNLSDNEISFVDRTGTKVLVTLR